MVKLFRVLIYILPAVLFFSYQPLIHFGSSESMNFEISLPLIWLVVFDIASVIIMVRRKMLFKGLKSKWLWLLLPLWLTLSIIWSLNPLRGILTVGVFWLIYLAIYSFWSLKNLFKEHGFWENFWRVFFGSSLVICAWCWLQCILDLCGVPREASLMCAGCTYKMFGFPHPDGFAIEPQFMGNLLLAPLIISGYFALKNKKYLIIFFIFAITLFLTFSRGAIYAFVISTVIMCIWTGVRQKTWRVLQLLGIVAGAFVLTLCAQGAMAAASPTNDTFQSGVSKVLNHLSLGVIDVREAPTNEEVVNTANEAAPNTPPAINSEDPVESEAAFDGYVAESTDTRLRLSGAALQIWSSDFPTAMFGVGLGGAGQALYVNGLSPAPKEIIQNQYTSLLLESGLIGITLTIFSLVLVVRVVWRSSLRTVIFILILAYSITLFFFSGLPNALHVYLLPALFLALFAIKNPKRQTKI